MNLVLEHEGPEGFIDVHSGGSSVFKVQGDGVAVGNCNPGNYGTLHVISAGDTSITGSTFYDGYGETGVSGNTVGSTHIVFIKYRPK